MQFDIQGDIAFLQRAGVLKLLLKDRTTGRHILWGTDAYGARGPEYARDQEMEIGQIVWENLGLLKTRAQKAAEQQTERTRQHAEVFTPAWICRMMNDQADTEWFGRENVFFLPDGTPTERVDFKKKSWKRYVDSKRLEITCGEAPYLVSRYDVSSGKPIPLNHRAGLLDRKLRVVSENTDTEADWLKWAFRAFEATYGYEFQGDNLLIARVNLMMTFGEYLKARWQRLPTLKEWKRLARAVVWNIWQMDGLTCALPYAKGHEMAEQTEFLSAFGFESPKEEGKQPYCRIYLWRYLKASTEFRKIKEGANGMKFDFIIGNPPYQEETESDSTRMLPIYDRFMDGAYEAGKKVELITPARFLFDAGQTPKSWNKKMLEDPHLSVLYFDQDASKIFPNTDIKGGIAITYHNAEAVIGPIGVFVPWKELKTILDKAGAKTVESSLTDIADSSNVYDLKNIYCDHPEYRKYIADNGRHAQLKTNVLNINPIFTDNPTEADDFVVYGLVSGKRGKKYCHRRYLKANHKSLFSYKVLVPKAAGSGQFGDTLPPMFVVGPNDAFTQTYLSIGIFDNEKEANNLHKYLKTKLCRALLYVLKVTQDNLPSVWKCIPKQDFTSASDIDWSQSIPDIDRQLYAKYGLDENEIAFIESHVKEMV